MTSEAFIIRGQELEQQRNTAREQLARVQQQVVESDRLCWAIDGAIQQNNHWLAEVRKEEAAAAEKLKAPAPDPPEE